MKVGNEFMRAISFLTTAKLNLLHLYFLSHTTEPFCTEFNNVSCYRGLCNWVVYRRPPVALVVTKLAVLYLLTATAKFLLQPMSKPFFLSPPKHYNHNIFASFYRLSSGLKATPQLCLLSNQ